MTCLCLLFVLPSWLGQGRDWLLQGLAVAVTGLQAVTTIQARWFNQNQALPAALTNPLFPLSGRAAGRGRSSSCRLILEGSSLCLCCGRRGPASAASAGAAQSSAAVSTSGDGPVSSMSWNLLFMVLGLAQPLAPCWPLMSS
jgi:hypothetical protein